MQKYKWIIAVLSTVMLAGIMAFILVKHISETQDLPSEIEEADRDILTTEEAFEKATHIVRAKYVRSSGDYDIFEPIELYKGLLDSDEEVLHVGVRTDKNNSYAKGKEYLLPLIKTLYVFYDFPNYTLVGEFAFSAPAISETDEDWISVNNSIKEKYSQITNPEETRPYGYAFTKSEDLNEIIDFSGYIFEVEVDEEMDRSPYIPQTTYFCNVKKLLKGVPESAGRIIIPFLNDTVEIGKDYIVLLSKADYKTTIYSLSSKNHSLYSADRVNDYPELKVLYEKAREYTTDYREKTVSDYLREEWEAVEKNEDCYYFHESGASLYFDEAIYYLQGDDEFIRNLTEMIPDIGVCYYKDGQYCLNDLSEKAVISRKDDSLELIVEGKEKVIFSKTTDK